MDTLRRPEPHTVAARRLTSIAAVLGLVIAGLFAVTGAAAADSSPGYTVFVGYADSLRHGGPVFPTPYNTGNGVVNEGLPSTASLDGGAIRIANATAVTENVDYVTVSLGPCVFDLWPHNVGLPFGGQLVLGPTASGGGDGCTPGVTTGPSLFDTSDIGPNGADWAGNCHQSGVVPEVTVSINGVATTYPDTGQVLNTGGVDGADCARPGIPAGNESAQWVPVGGTPCVPGAQLTLAPPTQTHDVGQTASVTATLSACGTPLQGATVDFAALSGPNTGTAGSGPAVTDANGHASFTYTSAATGTDTVQATVTNVAGSIPSNTVTVVWQKRPTAVTSTSALQLFVAGGTAALSSTLTDANNGAPLPGKNVTMTLGSGGTAQSCTAVTDSAGTAACSISPVAVGLGPQPVTDTFAGDDADLPSANTQHALVYAYSQGGSFVVGDRSATGSITFWGAQWSGVNTLSGGSAPASFKGFEDAPPAPGCGVSWTTDPGNSTPPPAGALPSYMAVLVASHVTKSGPVIAGDTVHVIIVRTDPGYRPDPGHPGTGTVVATVC
ncbi:MAG TPA: hypothetical protein VL652_27770 [Kutzneria sp.]|nr:hypothetical protein [Kutzneria sp.]